MKRQVWTIPLGLAILYFLFRKPAQASAAEMTPSVIPAIPATVPTAPASTPVTSAPPIVFEPGRLTEGEIEIQLGPRGVAETTQPSFISSMSTIPGSAYIPPVPYEEPMPIITTPAQPVIVTEAIVTPSQPAMVVPQPAIVQAPVYDIFTGKVFNIPWTTDNALMIDRLTYAAQKGLVINITPASEYESVSYKVVATLPADFDSLNNILEGRVAVPYASIRPPTSLAPVIPIIPVQPIVSVQTTVPASIPTIVPVVTLPTVAPVVTVTAIPVTATPQPSIPSTVEPVITALPQVTYKEEIDTIALFPCTLDGVPNVYDIEINYLYQPANKFLSYQEVTRCDGNAILLFDTAPRAQASSVIIYTYKLKKLVGVISTRVRIDMEGYIVPSYITSTPRSITGVRLYDETARKIIRDWSTKTAATGRPASSHVIINELVDNLDRTHTYSIQLYGNDEWPKLYANGKWNLVKFDSTKLVEA